uniref:CCHC-type domain-containing protein n=1 Tax=Sinocyclocheilus rhinocerous TaxID=307959 RepID=A0A673MWR6_9TELE
CVLFSDQQTRKVLRCDFEYRGAVVITLHMYNPYVTDEALMAFLARYAEVLTPARYVRDRVGLWTGKRQFQVLLRRKGLEGLMHPPAQFNIGADKGYLFYSRQPPICRRCRRYGHNDGGCVEQRCLQCAQLGHTAKECSAPKSCHSCGSLDHLMRDCKNGRKQYVMAAFLEALSGEQFKNPKQYADSGE